jgi:CheY-like chemotaxis protein/DNA-binding CsgD family transcriptional regulator
MATILVVDDEVDICQLVKINLEMDGHEVLTAVNGPEALDLVASAAPDLVILDIMMPGIDGWEVLSRIKSDQDMERSQIPVLMLTARTDDLDQVRGAIEGAIRYITKPFSVLDLRDEVARALEGEPEPVKRRLAQQQALERLARIEKGSSGTATTGARPHLTRFETAGSREPAVPSRPRPAVSGLAKLSPKQLELIRTVGDTPTVREAAERLKVSRSNVYASLRRIARKLAVRSVPELVTMARQGAFTAE